MTALLVLADSEWNNHMGDWGAGWWILMAFMMVVFWGLIIFGIVWLVRSASGGHWGWSHQHARSSAEELLDRRLANGEISPEEYRERRAVLRGEGGAAPGAADGDS